MRYLPAILSGLLTLAAMVVVGVMFASLVRAPRHRFEGPGEYRFVVDKPGDYTLWQKLSGVRNGTYYVDDEALPPGLRITVRWGADTVVPVRADSSTTATNGGETRRSVLSFKAPGPGEYRVEVRGLAAPRQFLLGPAFAAGKLLMVILGFFATLLGGLLTVVLLVLALTGLFPARRVVP